MPEFGYLTNPTRDILKEIKLAKKLGFDFVEIGMEGPLGFPEIVLERKKEILNLLKKQGMNAIAHTSWFMELGALHEGVRDAWLNEAKKAIWASAELGIELVNFHAHSMGMFLRNKKSKKQLLKNFSESMKELVELGKRFGVKIMLENTAGKGEIREFDDFRYIIEHTKNLYVHLDVGHAFIVGGMHEISKYIRRFRKKLVHIHIHDNHGEEDEHLALGMGNIDYEDVVRELKRIGYNGTITLEVFTGNDVLKESLRLVKKLWKIT